MPETSVAEKLKLLIATRNLGKVREFEYFFSGLPLQLQSLCDFPEVKDTEEPFSTFDENARHKALCAYRSTGLITLADDSGLEVDYLHGAPGVRSARYAALASDPKGRTPTDEENNSKLLAQLKNVVPEKRTARFTCVLVLAVSEEKVKLVRGHAYGLILFEPKGSKGFGYDPLFYFPPFTKTFAEMDAKEKLQVSHRGDALAKMRPVLENLIVELAAGKR